MLLIKVILQRCKALKDILGSLIEFRFNIDTYAVVPNMYISFMSTNLDYCLC
jgi:hypothetical protein